MKRFQTPTSRNPVLVRRRAENRTYEVRKSLPGSTKTGRYIEIQRLKRFIYILSIPILSELISAGFSLWKTPDRKGMGKGAEWHNTQFCGLRSTRATRQGRWKPITKDRKNNTPATPTLTQAGASTTFISSSQRAGTIISFKTALNRPGAYPATVTAWQTAGGQGKLHFPYAALRQLPLCELAGSEHLATQAIHFPQV